MKFDNRIQKFFEGVEKASHTLDLDLIGTQFADPNGTRVIEKQKFLPTLPKRREFFKALGHQSTKVVSIEETPIDDQYTMVKAHFLMEFRKSSGEIAEVRLDSTYILFMKGDSPRIVMHIEPEDLQQAMKDRELL